MSDDLKPILDEKTLCGLRPQLVLLIHGFRTYGEWMTRVKSTFESSCGRCVVQMAGFERLGLLGFLNPYGRRRRAIDEIAWKIKDAIRQHPDHELAFVAHSFGTYGLLQVLEAEPELIRPKRILLCASIIPRDYKWSKLANRCPILNDASARDIWPVLAQSVTWGYGTSGTFGFNAPGITERFHDHKHSDYFLDENIKRFWVSWLCEKPIELSDFQRPPAPYWMHLLAIFHVKWMVIVALLLYFFGSAGLRTVTATWQWVDGIVSAERQARPFDPNDEPTDLKYFPNPTNIAGQPTPDDVARAPAIDPKLVVFTYQNESNQHLRLFILDWSLFHRKTPTHAQSGWLEWPLDKGESLEYNFRGGAKEVDRAKNAGASGWFSFFAWHEGLESAVYLGTWNLFDSERPRLKIVGRSPRFVGEFQR